MRSAGRSVEGLAARAFGRFDEVNGKRARLREMHCDAMAGRETGPFQPLPGKPDSRFDLAAKEIPRPFDLE